MANFNSALITSGQKAAPRVGGQAVTVYQELAITQAGAGDTFRMIPIPSGARVIDWSLGSDDIDSNGAPAVTLSLGDSGSSARYVSLSTIGQTGAAPVDAKVKTGYGNLYTADDYIVITVGTAAATFAAGTIRCHVVYVI
jgi:hypothetical protein